MRVTNRRQESTGGDSIDRHIEYRRIYVDALTRRAEREARRNAETGDHQELDALFHVRDDAQDTETRLEQYEQRLRAAKHAGRYAGGTRLLRIVPDGIFDTDLPPDAGGHPSPDAGRGAGGEGSTATA
jgi:hypothetical protein